MDRTDKKNNFLRGFFFIYIDKIGEFYVNLQYEYKEYEVV